MTVSSTYSYTRNTYRRRTLRSIAPHHSPLPLGEGGRRPGEGALLPPPPDPRPLPSLAATLVSTVKLLTTPAAAFITGQVLTIDDGS